MQCTNMTFKVLAFSRKLWRLKIILEQIKLILDLVCRRHFCTWRAYTRSLSCENLKNTRLNVFALSYTTLILWPALEQSTGFFLFCLVTHKSRVYRSRDICKNWNAGYSLFVALKDSSYSLHALASLVRCARLNKKSPRRGRVGGRIVKQVLVYTG